MFEMNKYMDICRLAYNCTAINTFNRLLESEKQNKTKTPTKMHPVKENVTDSCRKYWRVISREQPFLWLKSNVCNAEYAPVSKGHTITFRQ